MKKVYLIGLLHVAFTFCCLQAQVFNINCGHSQSVISLDYSPDGKYLLSGSNDLTVKLWDLSSGKMMRTDTADEKPPEVHFSPDGMLYSTISVPNNDFENTKIKETESGFILAAWSSNGGYGCFSEYGKVFICNYGGNSKIKPKNPPGKKYELKIKNLKKDYYIGKIGVSKNGEVVVNDNYYSFPAYDENTNEDLLTNFIEISNDNNYILSGEKGYDKNPYSKYDTPIYSHSYLQVFDIDDEKPIVFENFPYSGVARFSPDSKFVAYGSAYEEGCYNPDIKKNYPDSCIVIYDIASGNEVRKINIHNILTAIAFSPDGRYLAYGIKKDGIIRILDFESGELISTLGGTSRAKPNFASNGSSQPFGQKFEFAVQTGISGSPLFISQDGKYAVTSVRDFQIKLWDIVKGKEIRTFKGSKIGIGSLCISPDNKYVISNGEKDSILVWDPLTGNKIRAFVGSYTSLYSLVFTKDGTKILAGYDNGIALFNFETGNVIQTYQSLKGNIISVCFTPDESRILVNYGRMLKLWDVASETQVWTSDNDPDYVTTKLAVSPDGMNYASSYDNSMAMIFKPVNEKTAIKHIVSIKKLSNNETVETFNIAAFPHAMEYSPDGNYLILGTEDSLIHIFDSKSWKEVRQLKFGDYISNLSILPDNNYILALTSKGSLKYIDLHRGIEIPKFNEFKNHLFYSHYFPGQNTLLVSGLKTYLWDLSTLRYKTIGDQISPISNVICVVSPDDKFLAESKHDNSIVLSDVLKRKVISVFKGHKESIGTLCFSPNSKILASGSQDKAIKLWDVEKGIEIKTLTGHEWEVLNIKFSPDGTKILSGSVDGNIILWDVQSGTQLQIFKNRQRSPSFAVAFTSDGKYGISGHWDDVVRVWDLQSGEKVNEFEIKSGFQIQSMVVTEDNKQLITGNYDGSISIWDLESGQLIKNLPGNDATVMSLSFSPDQKKVFSASYDGTARIIDIETGEYISFMIEENGEWIVYTSDGYWDASRNGSSLVAMVQGLNSFNIDQFAIKNNRPDIILQRLESTDNDLITHYNNQYKKRLRRSGITEDQLSPDLHVPQVNNLNQTLNGKLLSLNFMLDDSKLNLRYYQVFINDVPVFAAPGKEIINLNHLSINETIELTNGSNKIEVSCTNEKGQESYRTLTYANYNGETKGNLYFLAFGVSKYQNSSYNLQFADKDALDLEKVMQGFKGKEFENIYSKVLTNEQVTPDAIRAAKDFVKNAKVDDTFVLFIAGHGMHDSDPEATYYYLTSNVDLNNLKGTAADFETIEDLLQGIPPRNKLFLMDACESGEIDEEEQGQMIVSASGVGINSRGFKVTGASTPLSAQGTQSGSLSGAEMKRTYLFQKDRYIYNDLVRRSGAIVFSSSKGGELSYERSDIENGLFTEYIMKALTTSEADKDDNGFVSTDELRQFVSEQVAKASGDLQHPTVDRDNIYQKFGFQVK